MIFQKITKFHWKVNMKIFRKSWNFLENFDFFWKFLYWLFNENFRFSKKISKNHPKIFGLSTKVRESFGETNQCFSFGFSVYKTTHVTLEAPVFACGSENDKNTKSVPTLFSFSYVFERTHDMLSWTTSHVTDLYRRQSVCLLCFECIDGLPLDLVMHSYGNPLARHETEATPSGKVLCRRAKSLERTRQ